MSYIEIGGGYSYAKLRTGLVVRNPNNREIYVQPGDDENAMLENIASLDEVNPNSGNRKRGVIADMLLGEYFV